MAAEVCREHLVLAGGGHSHALVLRRWAMHPKTRPAALITLVNRASTALYSGMVPGVVSGIYEREQAAIDLRQLCRQAGVCFLQAEITGLNRTGQQLLLADRPALRFDWLSLDVGAVTAASSDHGDSPLVPVKPLEPLLALCDGLRPDGPDLELMGSGAAAVELALSLRARGLPIRLHTKASGLALGNGAANRLLGRLLDQAGIRLVAPIPSRTTPCGPSGDRTDATPLRLACTGSRGPGWLADSGLPTDARGRVRTHSTLVVEGEPRLLASGDCGVISGAPRPASGVWAVRAAPVLAANLARALAQRPLRHWRPQALALQLLGDGGFQGEPRAIALWGPLALGPSRWLWRWKDQIDRTFMARFAALPTRMGTGGRGDCRGCAAKLGPEPLQAALQRLGEAGHPAEDASAVAGLDDGTTLLQSVDGFPALVSDPWLNARLTTLHACSDLWACGATVHSAQAVVTLPQMAPELQSELLLQTLAGVRAVLDPLGAPLLGGHSLEARDSAPAGKPQASEPLPGLSLMLTINGTAPAGRCWAKGPLHSGDALILMRPIGTGVLFAAAMAAAAKASWLDAALAVMQQSQAPLVELLAAHGCRACTDITGFGLLGHLGEMLQASPQGLSVELDAQALSQLALPGALELLATGHASTLAPANGRALTLLEGPVALYEATNTPETATSTLLQLLIDPQTCGPLLAALPAAQAAAALPALAQAGFLHAAVIGKVMD
ncbi:MAG: selenide, water dikinase SelD [Cyanobacteriota bacterium]|nr:selenide, water dikinase SelD [Cyanobacteriota bacterium]